MSFPWGDDPDLPFGSQHDFRPDALIDAELDEDGPRPDVLAARRAILGGCLAAHRMGRHLSVSRNRDRYAGARFSYASVVRQGVDWMLRKGLLTGEKAPRMGPNYKGDRWQSRYTLTDDARRLCDSAASFPQAPWPARRLEGRVLLYDRRTHVPLPTPATERATSIRRFLGELAEATTAVTLKGAWPTALAELRHPDRFDTLVINTAAKGWLAPYLWQPGVRRDHLILGGRPVGHWAQNLPRWARHLVRIGGASIAEVDIVGSHLAMLYAERGIRLDRDPYAPLVELFGVSRRLAKIAILIAVNAPTPRSARRALAVEVAADRLGVSTNRGRATGWIRYSKVDWDEAGRLLNCLPNLFAPISDQLCADAGVRCQSWEADILKIVGARLLKRGVTPVPLHDAVLVPVDCADLAAEALVAAFQIRTGVPCGVKRMDWTR